MPPRAKQRRADTQVSGAVRNCGLQVTAHSSRNHGRLRMALPHRVGDLGERCERPPRLRAQRRDGHHAREFEAGMRSDRSGDRSDVVGSRPGPARPGDLVEIDLDQATHRLWPSGTAECGDEPEPIDRVHEARVADHRCAFVGLQRTDEVPMRQRQDADRRRRSYPSQLSHFANFCQRFLIATLTDLSDAKFGQCHDIGGWKHLGDRNQLDVTSGPTSGLACHRNTVAHRRQVGREFTTPDDVRDMARPVLRHRLLLRAEAELDGATPDAVITDILKSAEVPR